MNSELILRKNGDSNLIKSEIENDLKEFYNSDISELIENFILTKESQNTRKIYSEILSKFFKEYNINYTHEMISKTVSGKMVNFITEYLNKIKIPRTFNLNKFCISSFYKYLNLTYKFNYNPTLILKGKKTNKYSTTNHLEKDEIKGLLDLFKDKYKNGDDEILNLRNLIIFFFLMFSNRKIEVSTLKWANLDLHNKDNPFINIKQKGGDIKQMPLTRDLMGYLNDYKKLKVMDGSYGEYIFNPSVNLRGKGNIDKSLSGDMIYHIIEKAWEEYSLSKIDNEDFKKYFKEIKGRDQERKRLQVRLCRLKKSGKYSDKEGCIADYNSKIEKINKEIYTLKKEKGKYFGIKKITPHSFRASFIRHSVKDGIEHIRITNSTGHSSLNMIKFYANLDNLKDNAIHDFNLERGEN